MISFHIEKKPPTEGEITNERTILRKEGKRCRTIKALSTGLMLAAFPIVLIIDIHMLPAQIFVILLMAALVAIVPYAIHCDNKIRRLELEDSSLDPIRKEDCLEMLALCQGHEKIRHYQNTVATMGRHLKQGEFDAAKSWIFEKTVKEYNDRQQEACAMLATPE